jgi:hypothetical protein
MTMLAATEGGDAYTYRELDQMFLEAGFARTSAHPIPRAPHTIVVADASS